MKGQGMKDCCIFFLNSFLSKFDKKIKEKKIILIKKVVFQNYIFYMFIKNTKNKFILEYFCKQ